MKHLVLIITLLLCTFTTMRAEHTRIIVMSDIGGSDPDDQQSFIHLLTTLDKVDMEGFIYQFAWCNFDEKDQTGVTNNIVNAYQKVLPNLRNHSKGFPDSDEVRQMIKFGQKDAGMKGVGEGKDSPGSELIIKAVDNEDPRPVWVVTWSGTNTLAQAVWKIQKTRTPEEVKKFISKIRVYDVLGQDDAGAWLTTQYPELTYIRNKHVYGWAPTDEWTKKNVQDVGELGKVYPDRRWAIEGDTPSFLYFIDNGLNSPEHLNWGGWGGRFDLTKVANIESMDWVKKCGHDEFQYGTFMMIGSAKEGVHAINKWKEDIYNNFAARMQWSVTSNYKDANHHPTAAIGKNRTTAPIIKKAKAGRTLKLDASRSSDPDGNNLAYEWIYYKEAGTYSGDIQNLGNSSRLNFAVPHDAQGSTIHLILRVTDNGVPALTSYRRIVLEVK